MWLVASLTRSKKPAGSEESDSLKSSAEDTVSGGAVLLVMTNWRFDTAAAQGDCQRCQTLSSLLSCFPLLDLRKEARWRTEPGRI